MSVPAKKFCLAQLATEKKMVGTVPGTSELKWIVEKNVRAPWFSYENKQMLET